MTDKKKIYKPRPISGFPEWLPEVRRIEQQWFDHIRKIFESYGFCSIETPSVEELNVINIKGDGTRRNDHDFRLLVKNVFGRIKRMEFIFFPGNDKAGVGHRMGVV